MTSYQSSIAKNMFDLNHTSRTKHEHYLHSRS